MDERKRGVHFEIFDRVFCVNVQSRLDKKQYGCVAVTFLVSKPFVQSRNMLQFAPNSGPHKNVHKIYQQRCQALLLEKEIIFCPMNGDQRGIIDYPASNPLILQLNWSEMAT